MKLITIIAAALLVSNMASAQVFSVGRVPLDGGAAVFELYLDPPNIPECRNVGVKLNRVTAKLDSPKGPIPFGTGCWMADADGYVRLMIKSFDTGVVSTTKVHNSKFLPVEPPASVKKLIDIAENKARLCNRAVAAYGENSKSDAVCKDFTQSVAAVQKSGWCWNEDDEQTQSGWAVCR